MATIRQRRGTAAQWASVNPVLSQGEIGFEVDTGKFKFGDGATAWNVLAYFTGMDNSSSGPMANTLVLRDTNGRTSMVDPVWPDHVATKKYVDSKTPMAQWPDLLGDKIGFVGDSYSSGYGLTNPATERWTIQLCNMVGAAESNTAVPSSGYINQGSGGNSKFSTQAGLLATDCDTVFILGGINDAPLLLQGQTFSTVQTAVTTTINAVKARCPYAKIIVISPMWHAGQPSPELLTVENAVRSAIPSDVMFIEGGPYIRLDRVEWQIFDGHPNLAGATAIAKWVRDQLGGTPRGAEFGQWVTPGTADMALNQTNFPSWTLAGGTIYSAKSGRWELMMQMVMYNAVNGFPWVMESARKVTIRDDSNSTLPKPMRQGIEFYHPGGDLVIKAGYDANNTSAMIITNGQTKVWARYLGTR